MDKWCGLDVHKDIVLKEQALGWTVSGLFSTGLMLLFPIGQDSTISFL